MRFIIIFSALFGAIFSNKCEPKGGTMICSNIVGQFPVISEYRFTLKCINCSLPVLQSNTMGRINAKEVDLDNCNIEKIEKDAFENADKIEMLKFSFKNNKITQIDKKAFSGFKHLMSVHFQGNKLEHLKERQFDNLTAWDMNLGNNTISKIEGTMDGLNTVFLTLSHNEISRLKTNSFQKLYILGYFFLHAGIDLRYNRITYVENNAFACRGTLKNLLLSYNIIESIETNAFHNLTHLETLNLEHNRISSLNPLLFQSLKKLTQLNIGYNNITEVDKELLQPLEKLTELNMSNNQIKTLYFPMLPKLRKLDISYNIIPSFEAGAFDNITGLQVLYMSNNRIASLNPQIFIGLTKLSELNIGYNKIYHVDKVLLQPLQLLRELNMSGNKIKTVSFPKLPMLRRLDISNNQISTVNPEDLTGLVILTHLYMQGNRLQTLDIDALLLRNSNLKFLNVIDNFWSCKSLRKVFTSTENGKTKLVEAQHHCIPNVHGIACYETAPNLKDETTLDSFLTMIGTRVENKKCYIT